MMKPRDFWLLVAFGLVLVVLLVATVGCSSQANVAARTVPTSPAGQMTNPVVQQSTIAQTICKSGWTATVRPPTSYTEPIKRSQVAALPASADHKLADYELDHVVPLEVGGSPANPANLKIELWAGPDGAHAKDKVENHVHDLVCAGTISLNAGQECFIVDWRTCP